RTFPEEYTLCGLDSTLSVQYSADMTRLTLTLEIDPTDQRALTTFLEAVAQLVSGGPEAVNSLQNGALREDWAFAMTDGYGPNRRVFLREVAQASLNGSGLRQADCSLS